MSDSRFQDRSDYEKKMECWKSSSRMRSHEEFDRDCASSFPESAAGRTSFPMLAGPCDL